MLGQWILGQWCSGEILILYMRFTRISFAYCSCTFSTFSTFSTLSPFSNVKVGLPQWVLLTRKKTGYHPSDRPSIRRTDTPSYRVASSRLKSVLAPHSSLGFPFYIISNPGGKERSKYCKHYFLFLFSILFASDNHTLEGKRNPEITTIFPATVTCLFKGMYRI